MKGLWLVVVVSAIFINTMNCFSMDLSGRDAGCSDFIFHSRDATGKMGNAIEYLDRVLLLSLSSGEEPDLTVWNEWMDLLQSVLTGALVTSWLSLSIAQKNADVVIEQANALSKTWVKLLEKIPFQEDADALREWGRPFVPVFIVDVLDREKDWRTDQKSMHNYLWTLRSIRVGLREFHFPGAEQILVANFFDYCLAEVEFCLKNCTSPEVSLAKVPTLRHVSLQDLESGPRILDERQQFGGQANAPVVTRADDEVGCLDFFLKLLNIK